VGDVNDDDAVDPADHERPSWPRRPQFSQLTVGEHTAAEAFERYPIDVSPNLAMVPLACGSGMRRGYRVLRRIHPSVLCGGTTLTTKRQTNRRRICDATVGS
jgi:hypothetical protein